MNGLVILDQYWPAPEANGLCVDSILRRLPADDLTVLCRVREEKLQGVYRDGEHKEIIAVFCPPERKFDTLRPGGKLRYIFRHAGGAFFGSLPEKTLAERFYSRGRALLQQKRYDWMITVLNPIEAVEAGYRLKADAPQMKWILYDLDSASNCSIGKIESIFKGPYSKKVRSWETRVFARADLIVHLDNHKNHFAQACYALFREKTLFQGVPLLNIPPEPLKSESKPEGKLLYAGRFYHRLREPDVLLKIVNAAVALDRSIRLDVYTKDDDAKRLDADIASDNVHIHGYVDQKTLEQITADSAALVSLGNRTTEMFPSKILSYVSARKPIVHIYQSRNDPVVPFLKQYPDALLLDGTAEPAANADRLLRFLRSPHPPLDAAALAETFRRYTGAYCAQEILAFLQRNGTQSEAE